MSSNVVSSQHSHSSGKHGDRERFGFHQHEASSNYHEPRKTDRFYQVDNEVAVKCGAGSRFPHLSESSSSSDCTGNIVMVINIFVVVEVVEGNVSTIGGDLVHLVTIVMAQKGKGLVTRVVGSNRKSLMDMEVLKYSWYSLKSVRHIIGGRVLIR